MISGKEKQIQNKNNKKEALEVKNYLFKQNQKFQN